MRKIFKGFMAIALTFTSVFAVAGCGKDDDNKDDPYESERISESDWTSLVNTNAFSATIGNVFLDYNNGNYEINNITYDNNYSAYNPDGYIRNSDNYILLTDYDMNGEYQEETLTEDRYNLYITDIKEIIAYIKDNHSKFVLGEKQIAENTSFTGYYLDIDEIDIKDNVVNMLDVYNEEGNTVDGSLITVQKNVNNDYVLINIFEQNSSESYINIKTSIPTIDSILKYSLSKVENYKIVNNSGDVNQIELEVDSTGFHAITATQEFYNKDNGDGSYTQFLKEGTTFTSSNLTEYDYEMQYKNFVTAHIYTLLESRYKSFEYKDGKCFMSDVSNTDSGRNEYYFTNIEIVLNENNEISSMSWNYKVHDKQVNQDSPVYPITLTPNTTITYPTVG